MLWTEFEMKAHLEPSVRQLINEVLNCLRMRPVFDPDDLMSRLCGFLRFNHQRRHERICRTLWTAFKQMADLDKHTEVLLDTLVDYYLTFGNMHDLMRRLSEHLSNPDPQACNEGIRGILIDKLVEVAELDEDVKLLIAKFYNILDDGHPVNTTWSNIFKDLLDPDCQHRNNGVRCRLWICLCRARDLSDEVEDHIDHRTIAGIVDLDLTSGFIQLLSIPDLQTRNESIRRFLEKKFAELGKPYLPVPQEDSSSDSDGF